MDSFNIAAVRPCKVVVLWNPTSIERVGAVWLIGDFFGIISWCRLWEIRVISHCFILETKGHMVQTRSMASANQETRNPPTVVEWQLQTLSAAIERLTDKIKLLCYKTKRWKCKLSICKNIKSYRMINVEVVIITIHPFEILQKGTTNRRED